MALENARLFDETQRLLTETNERAAELAIINSVQEGLAAKLDMLSMYELVGDKLQEIFDAQVVDIGLYDLEQGFIHYPYAIERGVRYPDVPTLMTDRVRSLVDEPRLMVINDTAVYAAELGIEMVVQQGEASKSMVFAPLTRGGKGIGQISLQNLDRTHAFSESDTRLLMTLARTLSVALENARLFDETQRLLTETNERAAELAIINSVQQGLAEKLDMHAMYDLVGDKIRDIFDAQVVAIIRYDHEKEMTYFEYAIERGVRFRDIEAPFSGISRYMITNRAPVLMDDVEQWKKETGVDVPLAEGEVPKSSLGVPLITGDNVFGTISLQNLDRTHAFAQADVRLLTTLASSLSVALENARLFDETQRLLTETDARAAELAIINSVQQGLAAKLDMQSMYDLVGDKILEIFDTQVVDIGLYDLQAGTVSYPYSIELGVRDPYSEHPIGPMAQAMIDKGSTLRVNDMGEWLQAGGKAAVYQGAPAKAAMFAPLLAGSELRGHVSLQNIDRTEAFTAADERLLTTLASSLAVALENARLFDETQRLLTETNERAAELQIINSVQEGLVAKLDMQSMYDLVGDKIQEIFDAQIVTIGIYDFDAEVTHYPYMHRARRTRLRPRHHAVQRYDEANPGHVPGDRQGSRHRQRR